MKKVKGKKVNRRQFLAGTGAAMAFTIIKPELVRGTSANCKLNVGVVGCGGRGTWVSKYFVENGGYNIVAAADYFRKKVDKFGEEYQVPSQNRYTALSCYKRLLEQKLDAVVITSPPYFHPEHAAAAVDAGRHVFVAKPVSVDVPGCKSILESGKKATKKKFCFFVDFQTRTNTFFCEAIKRVHNGAIGEIAFGESAYHTEALKSKTPEGTPEARLQNWFFDRALSGDIITEQNIHTLDVMSWVMNEPPLYAVGTGGRKVRTNFGDCWDYFTLVFVYKNNVGVTFSSKQFKGHGAKGQIRNRMFGTKGTLETEYAGKVIIFGEEFYPGGETKAMYKDGAIMNAEIFYDKVTKGDFSNTTVAESVRSNLVTILGRTAAYEGRNVKWEEIIKSDEKWDGKLEGLKA
ncbi:MAG: Gfo/Idh/MocA family protein [Planctomycetota bacterium]